MIQSALDEIIRTSQIRRDVLVEFDVYPLIAVVKYFILNFLYNILQFNDNIQRKRCTYAISHVKNRICFFAIACRIVHSRALNFCITRHRINVGIR